MKRIRTYSTDADDVMRDKEFASKHLYASSSDSNVVDNTFDGRERDAQDDVAQRRRKETSRNATTVDANSVALSREENNATSTGGADWNDGDQRNDEKSDQTVVNNTDGSIVERTNQNLKTSGQVLADVADDEAHDSTITDNISVETDTVDDVISRHESGSSLVTMVTAPAFKAVHKSWEDFDAELKAYAKATYQLYVIRTTTSVKRRNQRIAETAAGGGPIANCNVKGSAEGEDGVETQHISLIPERFQWYSKTLTCTHGWKDRHRGLGKRVTTVVRSTCCPAKMCATVTHSGDDEAGWQVVLTKHVRTHNHPLSKQLYLYYIENRRIYDPELLLVPSGSNDNSESRHLGLHNNIKPLLTNHDDRDANTLVPAGALDAAFRNEHAIRDRMPNRANEMHASTTPRNSQYFHVPKVAVKSHASWEAFHNYISEYSTATLQVFRTRSTISVAAKNLKIVDQATKAGRSRVEVEAQLLPDTEKWYSKMLICDHGWKRKSRSKAPRLSTEDFVTSNSIGSTCPVILLARLERDVHDNWRVVINRQVVNHNHPLDGLRDTMMRIGNEDLRESIPTIEPSSSASAAMSTISSNTPHARELEKDPIMSRQEDRLVGNEIMVRVPPIDAIHSSWDAFHEFLKRYSDATYQLYRTRTTSSVQGRNQKIMEIKRTVHMSTGADESSNETNTSESMNESYPSDTRLIPEEWKWYSKTLTCTHGWKERRRGTGKRSVHVFRSTECPAKICATVQYVESGSHSFSGPSGWRVVVNRHVVDHNHTLSKALYQHYCENRRIYNPDLLAINGPPEVALDESANFHEFPMIYQTVTPHNDNHRPHEAQSVSTGDSISVRKDTSTTVDAQHTIFNHQQDRAMITSGHRLAPNDASESRSTSTRSRESERNERNRVMLNGMGTVIGSGALLSDSGNDSKQHPQGSRPSYYLQNYFGYISQPQVPVMTTAQGFSTHGFRDSNVMPGQMSSEVRTTFGSSSGNEEDRGVADFATKVAPSSHHTSSTPIDKQPREPEDNVEMSDNDDDINARNGLADEELNGSDAGEAESTTPCWRPGSLVKIVPEVNNLGVTIWRAPRMKSHHSSWDAFQEYLNEYSAGTYQLYRVRTTSSVSSRNMRILQQSAVRGALAHAKDLEVSQSSTVQLVPESHQWYSKTYVCTHGWKERRRGKGQRVSHNLRSTSCPVKVCVTLQRVVHDVARWEVVVTRHVLTHNHELAQEVYQQYSEVRRIRDPTLLVQAEELWQTGATRRKIYEFLKEHSANAVQMKDVHNLVQKWQQRTRGAGATSAGALAGTVAVSNPDDHVDKLQHL